MIGNADGVYQSLIQLRNDDLAFRYYLFAKDTYHGLQYLHNRGDGLDVSTEALKTATEDSAYFVRGNMPDAVDMKMVIELCMTYLHRKAAQIVEIVDSYLGSLRHDVYYYKKYPGELFLLALKARSYNVLVKMIGVIDSHYMHFPDEFIDFIEKVKETGERENDDCLLACYAYSYDDDLFEDTLKSIELNERNFELFTRSRVFYRKAVDYLVAKSQPSIKDKQRAGRICRDNGDYEDAARFYEQIDNMKSAGKMYRDAGLYRDALRCYEKIGDDPGAARTFEAMEDYKSAMQIWEKLGRAKDMHRIEKKLIRGRGDESEASQLELF